MNQIFEHFGNNNHINATTRYNLLPETTPEVGYRSNISGRKVLYRQKKTIIPNTNTFLLLNSESKIQKLYFGTLV